MAEQPDFDPRFDPAFQRGFDAPSPSQEEPLPVDDPASLRSNPWVWALWIVAVVFTVGAIAAETYVTGGSLVPVSSVGTPTSVYVMPLVLVSLAPWFLGAGLAAFIGVLLLSAVRWRPRG
ncbi:MAG: hypothetical protein ABJB03_08820 [Rhodoglobus sp.]